MSVEDEEEERKTIAHISDISELKSKNNCLFMHSLIIIAEELQNARESEARYKQQCVDAQRRERMLIRRLAAKEQEMQDYAVINASK